jgi:hypothetical protein
MEEGHVSASAAVPAMGGDVMSQSQRARENRAYVRELLCKREPAFAAVLATAEQEFFCLACPHRQPETVMRRLSTVTKQPSLGHNL